MRSSYSSSSLSSLSGYFSDGSVSTMADSEMNSPRSSRFSIKRMVESMHRRKEPRTPMPVQLTRRSRRCAVSAPCCDNGENPLHDAAKNNNSQAVELLLWSGADKTAANHTNKTALQVAKECNHEDSHKRIIDLLSA